MEFWSTFFTIMTWNVKKRINCLQSDRYRPKRIMVKVAKIGENQHNICDMLEIHSTKNCFNVIFLVNLHF